MLPPPRPSAVVTFLSSIIVRQTARLAPVHRLSSVDCCEYTANDNLRVGLRKGTLFAAGHAVVRCCQVAACHSPACLVAPALSHVLSCEKIRGCCGLQQQGKKRGTADPLEHIPVGPFNPGCRRLALWLPLAGSLSPDPQRTLWLTRAWQASAAPGAAPSPSGK
jgi:hypothetical protein